MNEVKTYSIDGLDQLKTAATEILAALEYPLVLFIGQLGAGKTTLIKYLIDGLGSKDEGSSPSYSLINEYQCNNKKVFHIDLYRLNSPEEAFQLGIEEYLYSDNYCFVEWPQLILDYIQDPYHIISIEILENNDRKITLV